MLKVLKRIDERAALMGRMAETLGIDVAEAAAGGRISPEKLRSAVLRCAGCDHGADCAVWLDAQVPGQSDAAPRYCPNSGQFAALV